ncbi:globin-like protein [Laetiporus sulphureus 93-53]|uniref:nitric oxide dioxygenase n=1 Tax=Laetiporus sulphureus 93-53 TaxID=1314785 RepID=A0A165CWN7_9APHY|nr:globin-like protein [Laetiporus sulphureus 93-53]KZT03601.1 globin-like protein [Laetiporus sulphureus 93-53]
MSLTPEQVQIIKSTVPILVEHGTTITTRFYQNMINAHPELKNVFNNAHQISGDQPRALAHALFAYASNIDNLGALGPTVELICNKHASFYIRPEQYDIVGTYLLAEMKNFLGDAFTPAIHDAWAAAYWQLAKLMINREAQLHKSADGWTDWRPFRIQRKVRESDEITSFYLVPVDGGKLPKFLPGQYISVHVEVPDLKALQARQYSLSDAPGKDYYRISVKRESGVDVTNPASAAHPGYVSNILHENKQEGDVIDISHPYGDFYFDPAAGPADAPVVLISAGVGLTSLISILSTLTEQHTLRPISWIHAARTQKVRAFVDHISDIVREHSNVHTVFYTVKPAPEDVHGVHYHHVGDMDLGKLDREKDLFVSDKRTQYFVCGPVSFMVDMERVLKGYGIEEGRVHVELYGTGGVPKA